MFEYCPVFWREDVTHRVVKRLNELGAENWQPAFVIGGTIILCRRTDSESENILDPFDKLAQLGNVPLGD